MGENCDDVKMGRQFSFCVCDPRAVGVPSSVVRSSCGPSVGNVVEMKNVVKRNLWKTHRSCLSNNRSIYFWPKTK